MTDYLTVAEVLAMHADLIARDGGTPGIRDRGRLEAEDVQTMVYIRMVTSCVLMSTPQYVLSRSKGIEALSLA